MKVALIDYGSGNLHSALKAFERAAHDHAIVADITLTADPDVIRAADRIVLPGVGAFADCRAGLDAVPGLVDALEDNVHRRGKPFLGICVGMQLMAERGLEKTITPGLGWIKGEIALIEPHDPTLKIPHMGWNTLDQNKPHALLDGIPTGKTGLHAYFVHSYQCRHGAADECIATADYGGPITAIVARDNMAGTQFHPEKSQTLGLSLLANFLRWRP
jgi:glutamine amidotransferase